MSCVSKWFQVTYKAIDILVSYISEQQFGAWNESSIFGSTIDTKSIICISPYFLTLTVFQHRPILFQTTLARLHLLVVKQTNHCFFNLYQKTNFYGILICQRMNYELQLDKMFGSLEIKDGPLNIMSQIYLGFRCVSSSLDTFFLFSSSSASTPLWSTDFWPKWISVNLNRMRWKFWFSYFVHKERDEFWLWWFLDGGLQYELWINAKQKEGKHVLL